MSNFHRRDFLSAAAAATAGVTAAFVGTRRAEAGDPSFRNNVPDPLPPPHGVPSESHLERRQQP
jgi:oxalate decarboxylase